MSLAAVPARSRAKPAPKTVQRITVFGESDQIVVPAWVKDLASFRQWLDTEDYPEKARICYLQGEVWIDLSREQVFTHGLLKTEYGIVVGGLVKVSKRGLYWTDGVFLANLPADIGAKPDGLFVSLEALESGRVRLVEGKEGGFVELEGSPDMALEVVSTSSVRKDTEVLRQAYWEAGIREYWLVDARRDPITFEILRHTARGYVPTRKQGGWIKSAVFGKSFRLTQQPSALGVPEFTVSVK